MNSTPKSQMPEENPKRSRQPVPTMGKEDWDQRYAAQELVWSAEPNRFLVSETAELAPGIALDLAAGEGRNAVWLAQRGWKVRAVDFSAVALEKGKALAASRQVDDRISFNPADLRTYEPEPQLFDLVTLIYLQIPQAELIPILRNAARAVAPGGTLLLVAHDSDNLKYGYGGPQHPALLYQAEQVVAALESALEIDRAGQRIRPVRVGDRVEVAIDCLVKGKRRA